MKIELLGAVNKEIFYTEERASDIEAAVVDGFSLYSFWEEHFLRLDLSASKTSGAPNCSLSLVAHANDELELSKGVELVTKFLLDIEPDLKPSLAVSSVDSQRVILASGQVPVNLIID